MRAFSPTLLTLSATVVALSLAAPLALAQCANWIVGPFDNGTAPNGANGAVYCAITWDPDGAGPQPPRLVIGGAFTSVGGVSANHVAQRDPVTGAWEPVGGGVAMPIYALTVYNNLLVAGGQGDSNPGTQDNNILSFDGSNWSVFWNGTGTGSVFALTVYNGQLYAGGTFIIYDTVLDPANYIARWNSGANRWEAVSSGMDGSVGALQVWNGILYVGGSFHHAGGVAANYIATYDGAFHALAAEPNGAVSALQPFNGQLVAGADFFNASHIPYPLPGGWNGSSWQTYGTSSDNVISSLAVYGGALYMAGYFTTADGATVNHIAKWSGSAWQTMGQGVNGAVYGLAVSNNELLVLGSFSTANGQTANNLARWNGSEWGAFGGGTTAGVDAFTNFAGRVVAGGNFHQFTESGPTAEFIVGWDGSTGLSSFGTGMNNPVLALKSYITGSRLFQTNELVAGGTFTTAGGVAANRIAVWDQGVLINLNPAWAAMGPGFDNTVYAIERFNSATYAGGTFLNSGATPVSRIARWNSGTSLWEALGTGMNGAVYALKSYGSYLYAGGAFTTAGGVSTGGLARWDGVSWSACGGYFNGTVNALEVHNGQLVIGGTFPGILSSPNLAQYDGTNYSVFGTGGTGDIVRSLVSTGSRLYVGGDFTTAGGVSVKYIAYWDGAWHAVPGGADQKVLALDYANGEIHAGGYFNNVGSPLLLSPNWARYTETGIPWLAQQPYSQNVAPGTDVTFTAQPAPGYSGWTLQWYKDGVPLSDGPTGAGSTVSGSRSTQLVITNTSSHHDYGAYDAVLTSGCGDDTSNVAVLSFDGYAGVPVTGHVTAFASVAPNPSTGATRIAYSLAREAAVDVRVFDVAGRVVRDLELGRQGAGPQATAWDALDHDGKRVRSGLYFVSLEVDGRRVGVKRVMMTR